MRDSGSYVSDKCDQPARAVAYIRRRQHDACADNADAYLARPRIRKKEHLTIGTADRAELVTRDNHGRNACQCSRVGAEVLKQSSHQRTSTDPEGEDEEKGRSLLWKARGQYHDEYRTYYGTDHAEPTFAQ